MPYTIILDEGVVLRESDGVQVAPCDSVQNEDFQAYIKWVAQGNEPTIIQTRKEERVQEPLHCDAWQMRKALNAYGLRDAVEAAIAASDDQDKKDGWAVATKFTEVDSFVVDMGAALGMDARKLHEFFLYASTL